ncbi:putative SP-containing membrane protein [Vairimorpha necatrix]|uniref:SP-containing membrane protein n=1 Tax=Vairimorpha necatrix TaxID=6039 RepID=A0AAX4JCA3_9MICR
MRLLKIFCGSVFFMLGVVKSNGEDNFLYSVINGTNVCESLDSKINNHNLPENYGILFSEFIWDTVTTLEIFKRLTQDDNSERSFSNRRIQLRDVYLSNLSLKNWDINISKTLIRPERKFIEELKSGAIEYFDMFRMCYKDIINDSKNPEETIRGIIKLHTCFVPNGISRNLPLPVFKMCKGLGFNFVKCFGTTGLKYIVDEANRKHDKVLKAFCSVDNEYSESESFLNNSINKFNNITNNSSVFAFNSTETMNNKANHIEFWERPGFIYLLSFIIIGMIFMFLGYIYFNKGSKKCRIKVSNYS